MPQPIRFQKPLFPTAEAIERYLSQSRSERWFSNSGPCANLLTARLAEAVGRPCVPVVNGTLGLMVAIAAVRRRARGYGEALLPSFAFAATAQAAVWNGLEPVFVDVAPDHWHLDPDALQAALDARGDRVAVVIALSSFGVPPPVDVRERWEAICASADVPLVVDSAAGFGARAADGVAIGGQGDVEMVSFHATKPLAAGEGGAVFCRDEDTAAEIARLINYTFDDHHQALRPDGLNAKMPESAAAAALAGLDVLGEMLARRAELGTEMLEALPPGFERQAGCERGTWQFVSVAAPDAATRAAALEEAPKRQIGVRTYYEPLHLMPAFATFECADGLEVTTNLGERMLSLPMAVDLGPEEVAAVVDMVYAATRASVRA
jgi:dTDP-4-amino-4,6-dideoxygalactose transaminase